MTHCRVEQDLNKHLAEEETTFDRMDAIEKKIPDVEERFSEILKADGIYESCEYLAGRFVDEAVNNVTSALLSDDNNSYFQDLVNKKAEWLLDKED